MTDILSAPLVLAFSRALLQFVWQGGAIALAAFAITRGFRLTARRRHDVGVLALTSMLVVLGATTWYHASAGEAGVSGTIAGVNDAAAALPSQADVATSMTTAGGAAPGRLSPAAAPLVLFWSIGVVLFSLRLAGAWIVARRLARHAAELAAPDIQLVARRLAAHLALDRVVRVVQASTARVPMMIGWLKPVVILPAAAVGGLTPLQLEAILAHELAHVLRQDYLVNLLQSIAETVLFYHPAVWWVSKDVRAAREQACDDLALGVCDRLVYATALADLAAMTAAPQLTLAATGGSLVDRVRRILEHGDPAIRRRDGWLPAMLVALVALGIGPLATIHAERARSNATPQVIQGVAPEAPAAGVATGVPGGVPGGVAGGVPTGAPDGISGGVPRGVRKQSADQGAGAQDQALAEKARRDQILADLMNRIADSQAEIARMRRLIEQGVMSKLDPALEVAMTDLARQQAILKSLAGENQQTLQGLREQDAVTTEALAKLLRTRELASKGIVSQETVGRAEAAALDAKIAAAMDQGLDYRKNEAPRLISPESASLRDRFLKPMPDDVLAAALKDAARITNDIDRAEVLIAAAKGQTLTPEMVSLFVTAASGIQSVDEKNRVFAQPVRLRPGGGR